VSDRDAQAVFAAGWDEQALYDAICVCALFNFMNRLVEGMGVAPQAFALTEAQYPDPAQRPAFNSYREFGRSIGVIGEFDD